MCACGRGWLPLLLSVSGKPIVSVNISGGLQAAQRAVDGRGNPVDIFGCGKNEIEQQLIREWPSAGQAAADLSR
jgi:hypothetical protein